MARGLRVAEKRHNASGANGFARGRRGRAALASVGLHALLALGLVLGFAGEPGVLSTAEIVRVDLVSLMPEAAPQTATAPAPPSEAPAPTTEVPAPPADAPAPPSDLPAPAPATATVDTTPPTEQTPPPAAPPTPEPSLEVEPEVAPPAEPKVVTDPRLPVIESEPQEIVPEPKVAAVEEPSAESPQTVMIDAAQLEMLDERVSELAARLDVVTERQEVTWRHRGQTYNATLERVPAADEMGIDEVKVTVSTEQDGQRLSTQLGMRRLAFSSFAQFVDRWDPQVQIHDDEIDGRFHSNSDVYIARSGGVQPAFHGKVTTSQSINTSNSQGYVRRDEVFLGGLETRVPKIWLPRRFLPFPDGRGDAQVHELPQDARITFYADGSYGWAFVESAVPEERMTLGAEPHYLVAAEKAALFVRGTVNGKVLVYSPQRIVIEDDLTYAVHPAFSSKSDDYLGLVSDGNVEIADPESTGPGNVTVHAAIFAKRSFNVRNYNASGLATLSVYGSVAAGSISATEPRFRTKLEFDDRLTNLRPPSFPLTDRYELAAWDGRWILDTE
jgi:hypothetical protein